MDVIYKIVYRYGECLPYRGKLTSVQLGCLFFDVFLWGERRRQGEREDVRSLVRGERKRGGEKKAEVYKIVLVIKNRKQMKDSEVQIPDNWKGKIVFADGTSMIANRLGNFFGKLFDRARR